MEDDSRTALAVGVIIGMLVLILVGVVAYHVGVAKGHTDRDASCRASLEFQVKFVENGFRGLVPVIREGRMQDVTAGGA